MRRIVRAAVEWMESAKELVNPQTIQTWRKLLEGR